MNRIFKRNRPDEPRKPLIPRLTPEERAERRKNLKNGLTWVLVCGIVAVVVGGLIYFNM